MLTLFSATRAVPEPQRAFVIEYAIDRAIPDLAKKVDFGGIQTQKTARGNFAFRFSLTVIVLALILSRWLWERGEKGGASLQKQARVCALCGVMQ